MSQKGNEETRSIVRTAYHYYANMCATPTAGTVLYADSKNQNTFMRSLLYVIAVILIIGWALGAFVYSAGSIIHILLVLAIISILLSLIRRGTVD